MLAQIIWHGLQIPSRSNSGIRTVTSESRVVPVFEDMVSGPWHICWFSKLIDLLYWTPLFETQRPNNSWSFNHYSQTSEISHTMHLQVDSLYLLYWEICQISCCSYNIDNSKYLFGKKNSKFSKFFSKKYFKNQVNSYKWMEP